MTPEEMDSKGDWYWIPHETECFIPARVLSHTARTVTAKDMHGVEHTVKAKFAQLEPLKRSSLQRIVSDLVLLDVMSAPLILHNLKQRFFKNEIYTNVGTILIAINPYKVLPLYTEEVVRSYARRKLGQEMPPHSFNIAHDAFVGLRDFEQNQSIIISGESGAGKTETTKHCLHYLAYMAGTGSNIANGILQTNPVLEAFGNAKTLRNDNSSRFGKFMQINFSGRHCAMSGCIIRTYLLEKIRIVHQTPNERNFHIFYQLTKGASEAQRRKYHLLQPHQYNYLKTCTDVPSIDDLGDWKQVEEAFTELKFSDDERDGILSVVSAVAMIGNIKFKTVDGSAGDRALVEDESKGSPVAIVSELLKVPLETLSKGLVNKRLRIIGAADTFVELSPKQAVAQRDAFAKFLYGQLFEWLVERLNRAIGVHTDTNRYIGCLDIFGFEIFENNSFEQLCINFTNEMLQQHFNYQTFKLEEMVYKAENIKFKHIEFIDNQPMLDLIAKKPTGLIPLLDEELIVPGGNERGFLNKLTERHTGNPVFGRDHSSQDGTFRIRHYAGEVTYEVTGFMEKNRDTLNEDQLDVLRASTHSLVNTLFPPNQVLSTREKKRSLGSQFNNQLQNLMETLRRTEPHYIRCIKPNPNKAPLAFVPRMCHEQLTYSGVFEAVAIRKAGYPFRLKHETFAERYSVLFEDRQRPPPGNVKATCEAIIDMMKLNRENVQMGTTMVLYRADEHKKLELHRNIKVRLTETHEDLARLTKIDPYVQYPNEADRENYFIELAAAVRSADEFRINTRDAEIARQMLDRFVEERMDPVTKRQLEEAYASKDMKKLEAVLRICEAHGYQTSIVRKCQDLLEKITDAEAALRVAMQEVSEEFLEKAIAMCEEFAYESENVQAARDLLANLVRAKEMIARSMQTLNHEHLKKTLDFCASFNYNSLLVQECQAKYDQVMSVRAKLNEARKDVDIKALTAAIEAAQELGYDAPLVYECTLLLGRLERIEEEANRAAEYMNDPHIRAVLRAADEVKYKSKAIKKLQGFVSESPEDYLTLQIKAASLAGDHERAIRLTLQLTNHKLRNLGPAQLNLRNFEHLKDPLVWGKEKFWGSAQRRADTFLSWTDASLHAPLTRVFEGMPSQRYKFIFPKMVNNFETIQKYMGQRNTSRLPQRIEEFLMDCMEIPEIRDEAYLALMKQLTLNPQPEAVPKGWQLMTLALLTFPPSVHLENYLLHFLNSNQSFWNGHDLAYYMVRIVYLDAVARPFWRSRESLADVPRLIQSICPNVSKSDERFNSSAAWEDLLVKFDDDDYEEKVETAFKRATAARKRYEAYLAVSKKLWLTDIIDRKRAADLRNQGISASTPPTGMDGEIIGSHAPELVVAAALESKAPLPELRTSTTLDSASGDGEEKKKKKKKKAKAAAAEEEHKAVPEKDDDEEEEPTLPSPTAQKGEKKKKKKKGSGVPPEIVTALTEASSAAAAASIEEPTKKKKVKKVKKAAQPEDDDF